MPGNIQSYGMLVVRPSDEGFWIHVMMANPPSRGFFFPFCLACCLTIIKKQKM
jgi:hypothetical protein